MKTNMSGFSAVGIIVSIIVFSVVGFAGYTVLTSENQTSSPVAEQPNVVSKNIEDSETSTPESVNTKSTIITTANSEFGTILFDGNNQAIYIWELEESSKAECYGDCAKAWPPVLTEGAPTAAGGINNALLGTTMRTDGTMQVTYNNHPLYYYANEAPGEVKCHDIATHGGLWWVIKPDGVRAD